MKKLKKIRITKEQLLQMERTARRESEIEAGISYNRHRVHKSAKSYTRKTKYKHDWA